MSRNIAYYECLAGQHRKQEADIRYFLSHLRILAVILVTAPASAQWEKLNVPTTAGLRGLSVVSDDVVWASGAGGTVIRTLDGGKHWTVIVVPGAANLDFRGIRAFDQKTAVIISSGPAENGQARIYRTNNGGASWQQVFEEKRKGIFFDAIAFWNRRHGIVLSDPVEGKFVLFSTADEGKTWRQIPAESLPAALSNEGAFAASNSCLTLQGTNNVWFATGGGSVARVFHSANRGRTWSVAETPMHPGNSSSGIFSLAFRDEAFGVAVGGDYAHPERSQLPNILVSHDGGKSWKTHTSTDPPGLYLSSVAIVDAPRGFASTPVRAAGTSGLYYFLIGNSGPGARENEETLNTVVYSKHGTWAVGPRGSVLVKVVH